MLMMIINTSLILVPTGLEILRLSLHEIVEWLLIAGGIKRATAQLSRNEIIRKRFVAGETLSDIARDFNISPQRVYQIVNFDGAF